ncbi:MAG: hypothetical protein WC712_01780 [Candidatus Brocadiia bacterium]
MKHRISALVLCSALLLVTFLTSVRAEDPPAQAPELLAKIPAEALLLVQFQYSELPRLSSMVQARFMREIIGAQLARVEDSNFADCFARMMNIPGGREAAIAWLIAGNGLSPVLYIRIPGGAEPAVAQALLGTDAAVSTGEINGFPSREIDLGGRQKLAIVTAGDFALAAGGPEGLVAATTMFNPGAGLGFDSNPAITYVAPLTGATIASGVFDIAKLAMLAPNFKSIFEGLGINDPAAVSFSLDLVNGVFHENVSVHSLTEPIGPAALLAGMGPIPTEGSLIPDTAIASARVNLDFAALVSVLLQELPRLGGQGQRMSESLFALAEAFGYRDASELFGLIGPTAELFFDYPEGTVLPDFVLIASAADPGKAAAALDFAATEKFGLKAEKVAKDSAVVYFVPQKNFPADFPWGLCFGIIGNRAFLTSNYSSMVASLARAKTNPLVATPAYAAAFAGLTPKRSAEVFVKRTAMIGIGNIIRLAVKGAEKARLPAGAELESLGGTAIVLGGDVNKIILESRGSATPALLITVLAMADPYIRMVRRTGVEAGDRRALAAWNQLARYYRLNKAMPQRLGDLMTLPEFDPRPFLPKGVRVPPGGFTAEQLEAVSIFMYFAGLDPKKHPNFVVLSTKKVEQGKLAGVSLAGKYFEVEVDSDSFKKGLETVNKELGTNYRIEDGFLVGP